MQLTSTTLTHPKCGQTECEIQLTVRIRSKTFLKDVLPTGELAYRNELTVNSRAITPKGEGSPIPDDVKDMVRGSVRGTMETALTEAVMA